MKFEIKNIEEKDKAEIISMMEEFYSSNAVFTNGSYEIFNNDIENCIKDNPYIEGYVFSNNDGILGYAMIAKSFSTEFGKPCIWYEDLYLKKNYRGFGIIPEFVKYIENKYPDCIYRLEAEKENEHACYVYKKLGFEQLPYIEMKKGNK